MTEDQYSKAQNIKDQIRNCRTMIEYIEKSSSFQKTERMGDGIRGLNRVLMPEYKVPVDWFRGHIDKLNKDLEKI